MARRVRIVTARPDALPRGLPFAHEVEAIAEGGWDDDDPPDETVLHFAPDLPGQIANLEPGRSVKILLAGPEELEDERLEEAVEEALLADRELRIRVRD